MTRAERDDAIITALCAQCGRLAMRIAELERRLEQAQSVAIARIAAMGSGPGGAA